MKFEKQAVRIFKALGDDTRYRIIRLLLERGELSCADFDREFHLSKSAMSHHYRVLENSGLITTRKAGQHIYMKINKQVLERFLPDFEKVHSKSGE
ncbi:MAG: helix-turn-helix transcriptional regulator [Calditrichaeota bacterium]|nr:helix-turn-helix transcriptional regulator [Calditrichota bacterium]